MQKEDKQARKQIIQIDRNTGTEIQRDRETERQRDRKT